MMCTVSFVQVVQMQGATPSVAVFDRQGKATAVLASSISNKRLVENFLEAQGLADLCSLSLIRERALAKAYSEWLRARKRSKYALIDDSRDTASGWRKFVVWLSWNEWFGISETTMYLLMPMLRLKWLKKPNARRNRPSGKPSVKPRHYNNSSPYSNK
jgi:hypothetical protein